MEEPSQFSVGQTAQSLACSIMEKPHTGLDDCMRMLQACFRKRMSDCNLTLSVSNGGGDGADSGCAGVNLGFMRCPCTRNQRAHLARGGLFGVADALEAAVLRLPGDEPVPLPRAGPGPGPAGHAAGPPLAPLGVEAVDGAGRLRADLRSAVASHRNIFSQ